ncbi:hypothetical protein HPB52_004113 [Rhipicephalus sanguineus]|uniref:Tick transposon n=1 Tax=Rhipicephalus sanguineus TaxID=34632 RepID=A0A9D4PDK6_RHISA|nr:hypothetical protein HPB52_004113 [Rhipicephalus sanguineus]
MPELPSTHRKIINRPRDGLDLRKTSCYGISTAIFTAAGITAIQASSDLVCPNVVQNIVVVCTEKEDNARKILALKNIRVNGKEHEVAVYAAAEGNYVKGGHTTGDKACKQKYQTPFVIRQRRKEREMERAFDMDLRDFPTLGAGMPRPSSGGWLQPFTVGGGSALPITAKWASKAQNPEPYRTQAGPSTQVSGGTVTANESEELKKVRNENAKLSSELAQVKKELASLKNAVSASRQDGDQNGANGRKRRAVGDVPEERAVPLPDTVRSAIMVHPLPRNMHPVYNHGRRRARAKAFLSQLNSRRENALFVDASRSGPNSFVAAVVDMSGRTVSAASVRTRSTGVAEQVAISLALTTKDPCPIFSDSMTAVRRRRVSVFHGVR